jgi:hypothetical protein
MLTRLKDSKNIRIGIYKITYRLNTESWINWSDYIIPKLDKFRINKIN